MLWVSLFHQEETKSRHVFMWTIFKEKQTGPSTESTAQVTYESKEYKCYMHLPPKRDMNVTGPEQHRLWKYNHAKLAIFISITFNCCIL